jgi:hypothetical protein
VRPTHSTCAVGIDELAINDGPGPVQDPARFLDILPPQVELIGKPGRELDAAALALPPMMIGGRGCCTGLGRAGESFSR